MGVPFRSATFPDRVALFCAAIYAGSSMMSINDRYAVILIPIPLSIRKLAFTERRKTKRKIPCIDIGRNTSTRCFAALFPRKHKNHIVLAGLLTCPSLNAFPSLFLRTVACRILKDIERTYSSGSVQDLHLIPFSSHFSLMEWRMRTKIGSKDKKKNTIGCFLF